MRTLYILSLALVKTTCTACTFLMSEKENTPVLARQWGEICVDLFFLFLWDFYYLDAQPLRFLDRTWRVFSVDFQRKKRFWMAMSACYPVYNPKKLTNLWCREEAPILSWDVIQRRSTYSGQVVLCVWKNFTGGVSGAIMVQMEWGRWILDRIYLCFWMRIIDVIMKGPVSRFLLIISIASQWPTVYGYTRPSWMIRAGRYWKRENGIAFPSFGKYPPQSPEVEEDL